MLCSTFKHIDTNLDRYTSIETANTTSPYLAEFEPCPKTSSCLYKMAISCAYLLIAMAFVNLPNALFVVTMVHYENINITIQSALNKNNLLGC